MNNITNLPVSGLQASVPSCSTEVGRCRGRAVYGMLVSSLLPLATENAWASDTFKTLPAPKFAGAAGESWLSSQIRLFRSYPHLDQAYRLIAAGKQAEAARELKIYIELEPQDKQSRLTYMNVLYQLKRYDGVLQEAQALLQVQPGSASAYLYQGLASEAQGRKKRALNSYVQALATQQLDAQNRKFAANAAVELAFHTNQYGEALKVLEAVKEIQADPNYLVRRAAALAGLQRYDEAIAGYNDALAAAVTAQEKRRLHETLFSLEKQLGHADAAMAHVNAILEFAPADLAWLRTKATMHYLEKDNAQVIITMTEMMRQNVTVDDHFFLGNVFLEERRFLDAIKEYSQVVGETAGAPGEMQFRANMGLGYAYAAIDRVREAHQAFHKAAAMQPAQEARQALANVTKMLKLTKYQAPGERHASQPSTDADGYTEGRDAQESAQKEMLRQISGSAQRKAAASKKAGQQAERAASAPPPDPSAIAMQKAYQQIADKNDEAAAASFQQAVASGAESEQLYLDMAFAYARLKQPEKAREAFLAALQLSRSGRNIMYVARSYVATGQPQLALQYFKMARQALVEFAPEEQKTILVEIGHVSVATKNYAAALDAWREALLSGPSDDLLLNIAYAEEMTEQKSAALATLNRVDEAALPQDLKFRLYTQLARIYESMNDSRSVLNYLTVLAQMDPVATRYYQLGLYEMRHNDEASSIQHFRRAMEIDPVNLVYPEQLAYLYKKNGNYAEAAKLFEHVISHDPGRTRLYQDLAYTYKQQGDNDNAVAWFKKSIDVKLDALDKAAQAKQRAGGRQAGAGASQNGAQRPPQAEGRREPEQGSLAPGLISGQGRDDAEIILNAGTDFGDGRAAGDSLAPVSFHRDEFQASLPVELPVRDRVQQVAQAVQASGNDAAGASEEEVYRMRQEVRELSRRFQLNMYQSYRSKSQAQTQAGATSSPAFFNSGVIPSQGGVELIYQPPGIGYQDGKVFQLYSRMLWSNQPDSLSILGKSVQAGFGARYKPFKTQDMFFSLERLMKVGDQAQNDWLARVSYALTDGYELKQNESSWNQTIFYGDLGRFFPNAGITALYSELRQGRSFNIDNKAMITPHVLLAGRKQRPDPGNASYLEAGAGVAVKYRFNESRYEAERSSMEFLVQYRRGLNNQHIGSWVFTAALQF